MDEDGDEGEEKTDSTNVTVDENTDKDGDEGEEKDTDPIIVIVDEDMDGDGYEGDEEDTDPIIVIVDEDTDGDGDGDEDDADFTDVVTVEDEGDELGEGDLTGEGEEIPGEGDLTGEGEEIPGEGDLTGEGEEIPGVGDLTGEGEEIPGEGDLTGEGEEIPGEGNLTGEGEGTPGEGEDLTGEDEGASGEGEDLIGKDEGTPGESEDLIGEGEGTPGEGEDLIGEGEEIPGEGEVPAEEEEQIATGIFTLELSESRITVTLKGEEDRSAEVTLEGEAVSEDVWLEQITALVTPADAEEGASEADTAETAPGTDGNKMEAAQDPAEEAASSGDGESTGTEAAAEASGEEPKTEAPAAPETVTVTEIHVHPVGAVSLRMIDVNGTQWQPAEGAQVLMDLSGLEVDWSLARVFRMEEDGAVEVAAAAEDGLITFETLDFGTFAVATVETIVTEKKAEAEVIPEETEAPEEVLTGLDPEKVEAWKEGLRQKGYTEGQIAEMEQGLHAEPGTLQYLINQKLIESLSYENAKKESDLLSFFAPFPGARLRASGITISDVSGDPVFITLDQDYAEKLVINAGSVVTLDLNGHSLKYTADAGNDLILIYGTLVLKDSAGGGTVDGAGSTATRGIRVAAGGTLTMEGGTVQNFHTLGNGGGINVENRATFVMNGGTLQNNTADNYGGGLFSYDLANAQLQGGTISGNTANYGGGFAYTADAHGQGSADTLSVTISGNRATAQGGGIYGAAQSWLKLTGQITGNQADGAGGGIAFGANATIDLEDGAAVNGNESGSAGGGLYFANPGKVTVEAGATINGNQAATNGGGVCFASHNGGNSITIHGQVNENDAATSNGGGIYVTYCDSNAAAQRNTVDVDGGQVNGNSAQTSGGGIIFNSNNYTDNQTLIIQNQGHVDNNRLRAYNGGGGGVYMGSSGHQILLKSGSINGNEGAREGGGLYAGYLVSSGIHMYEGMEVCGNTAQSNTTSGALGGGIELKNNNRFYMYGGKINDNRALNTSTGSANGGGLSHMSPVASVISGGEIKNNTAKNGGGGLYSHNTGGNGIIVEGTAVVENNRADRGGAYYGYYVIVRGNAQVINNRATTYGGALGISSGTIVIGDAEQTGTPMISGNTAGYDGGAVHANQGTLTIHCGTISGNRATGIDSAGGGVCVYGTYNSSGNPQGLLRMYDGTITGNTATYGGGVALSIQFHTGSEISGGVISNNTATYGGGIYTVRYNNTNNTKTPLLTLKGNVQILNNTASSGGGVFINRDARVKMDSATITGNKATSSGGGIYINHQKELLAPEKLNALEVTGGAIYGNTASSRGRDIMGATSATNGTYARYWVAKASDLKDKDPNYRWYQEETQTYLNTPLDNSDLIENASGSLPYGGYTFIFEFDPVAQIGQTQYATVAEAIRDLETGENEGEIFLLKDVTEDVVIPENLAVELDLKGCTLSALDGSTITVKNGADLTLRDSEGTGALTLGRGTAVDGVKHGSALFVEAGAKVNVKEVSITENGGASAIYLAGGEAEEGATLLLEGTRATGNNTSNAIIYTQAGSTLDIQGGAQISNNTATEGAIVAGGTVTLAEGEISGNSARGVNLLGEAASFTMTGGKVSNNGSVGLRVDNVSPGGSITVSGGEISGNTYGAALSGYGTLTVTDGLITGNKNSGIYCYSNHGSKAAVLQITGGQITGNTGTYAGGIYLGAYYKATITGGEISGNTATGYGAGAIYAVPIATVPGNGNATLTVSGNTTITGNKGKLAGGMALFGTGDKGNLSSTITQTGYLYNITGGKIYANNSVDTEANDIWTGKNVYNLSLFPAAAMGMTDLYDCWYDAQNGIYVTDWIKPEDAHTIRYLTAMLNPENGDPVARIGETTYTSLQAAVNDAIQKQEAGETDTEIHLIADFSETVSVPSGDIHVNLNGHLLGADYNSVFNVVGGSLTLKDDPSQADYVTTHGGGALEGTEGQAGRGVNVMSGVFTLESGTIRNFSGSEYGGAVYVHYDASYATKPVVHINGGLIDNCSATFGGAIAAESAELNITGGTLQNCHAETMGGAVYAARIVDGNVNPIKLNITGGSFLKDSAGSQGGAIYFIEHTYGDTSYGGGSSPNAHTFNISGSESEPVRFEGCYTTGSAGGAVFFRGVNANLPGKYQVVKNSTFTNCHVPDNTSGGAVYMYLAQPKMENVTFTGNRGGYGGAMRVEGQRNGYKEYLTNVTFTDNTAAYSGGALYSQGNTTTNVIADQVTATGNKAEKGGGGAFWCQNYLTVTNSTFEQNEAHTEGGAIRNTYSTTLSQDRFLNNISGDLGGAVRLVQVNATGCEFSENKAASNGGAMYISGDDPIHTLTGCTFEKNTGRSGGAIYWIPGSNTTPFTITGSRFAENQAVTGGVLCLASGSHGGRQAIFGEGCVVENNRATGTDYQNGGGAIYASSSASILIDGAAFRNNSSAGYGGAINGYRAVTVTMNSGEMSGNSAVYGGAINLTGYSYTNSNGSTTTDRGQILLNGGTLSGNSATYGGAVRGGAYTYITVNGATIRDNSAKTQGGGTWSSPQNTKMTLSSGAIYDNTAALGQDVYVAFDANYTNSFIDLIKAEDMFAGDPDKTGIGWFDELTEEVYKSVVTGRLSVQSYPLTLRYEDREVVAVIWDEDAGEWIEFSSVQSAMEHVAAGLEDGTYTEADPPTVKMVKDSTESVEVGGTVSAILNLNGHTLTGNGTSAISCAGTLIIEDVKAEGDETSGEETGTITGIAADAGGGVRVRDGGNVTMTSGQIASCYAGRGRSEAYYGGGAVAVEEGVFELTGTASLNGNSAYNGGAVLVTGSAGTFKMSGGVIEENTAASAGAAIYNNGGKVLVTGGEIRANTTTGVKSAASSATTTATGGALYNNTGEMNIIGQADNPVLIHDNKATYAGGAIYVRGGTVNVSHTEIYENSITSTLDTAAPQITAGGGVYVYGGKINLADGANIHGNNAPRGGGVFMRGGTADLIGGSITENTARKGGGVAQYWGASSTFLLSSGLLAGNISTQTSAGNDMYSAFEGSDADLATYISNIGKNNNGHPRATLIQASQMGDSRYNVWKDDDYKPAEGTEFTPILYDADGNVIPSYIGESQYLTGYLDRCENLQLTADYYNIHMDNHFDGDVHVGGLKAHVAADGTPVWDTLDTGAGDTAEVSAKELLAAGQASLSERTYQYSSIATNPGEGGEGEESIYHYISYNGQLYEQDQMVTWTAGDDTGAGNRLIRTFDRAVYAVELSVTTDEDSEAKARNVRYWIEVELPCDADEAIFAEPADADMKGYIIMTGVNESGQTVQILRAYYDEEMAGPTYDEEGKLVDQEDGFTKSTSFAINVYGMKNGDTIKPTFRSWVEGNAYWTAQGEKEREAQPEILTVSAAPKYNVSIQNNSELVYTGYFDPKTGAELSEKDALLNPESSVYGMMAGYGITVSLYNDAGKKLKGIEIPKSPLEFDTRFSAMLYRDDTALTDSLTGGYLWAYKENERGSYGRPLGSNVNDRKMDWNDEDDLERSTSYAYNAAPFNTGGGASSCYNGGAWTMSGSQFNGTDPEATYHVKVTGFDFQYALDVNANTTNPNNGSNGSANALFNSANVMPFTAGYVQVLYPFDLTEYEVSERTYFQLGMHAAVTEFDAESISGAKALDADDPSGMDSIRQYDFPGQSHDWDGLTTGEQRYGDNYAPLSLNVALEAGDGPGDFNYKYNDFTTSARASICGNYDKGYAPSTPLGSTVYIHGWAKYFSEHIRTDDPENDPVHYIDPEVFNTQIDNYEERNYMTALNILQKFDADVFTPVGAAPIVNKEYTVGSSLGGGSFYVTSDETATSWSTTKTRAGRITVLYAAKPDGKNWVKSDNILGLTPAADSSSGDVWATANDTTVDNDGGTRDMDRYREEDLLYFTSLDDLHAALGEDSVCVGFLYELRDVVIRDTRTLGVQAKMTVSNDFEHVGHTYETTNDIRAWSTYRRTYKTIWREKGAQYADRVKAGLLYTRSFTDGEYTGTVNGVTAYGPRVTGADYDWQDEMEISATYLELWENWKDEVKTDAGYNAQNARNRLWTHWFDGTPSHNYSDGYVKAEYVKGYRASGTHNSWEKGNSLLIYTLTSGIDIRTTDKDIGSNTTKDKYNVTNGDRTANYRVTPSLSYSSAATTQELVSNGTLATEAEITLTLDPKLNYNPGSMNFDYSGSGYAEGELAPTIQVTKNADGTTTIRVVFTVYDIDKKLPVINYSCTIGDPDFGPEDVVNGQSLNTHAEIRAKYTSDNQIAADARKDNCSITVIKNDKSAISKTVEETLVEVGEDLVYVLRLHNLSQDASSFTFGDVLPYVGDGRDTSFTGGYRVKGITMTFTAEADYQAFRNNGGYLAFTNTKQSIPKSVAAMQSILSIAAGRRTALNAAGWDDPTRTVTYDLSGSNAWTQKANEKTNSLTMMGYLPKVSAKTSESAPAPGLVMRLVLSPMDANPDNEGRNQRIADTSGKKQTGNNIYGNTFFYKDGTAPAVSSSKVKIATIDRRISGRVWLDQNQDGLYTPADAAADDHPMKNVTVTLLQKTPTRSRKAAAYGPDNRTGLVPAVDVIGNPIEPIYTDKNGFYSFDILAEGEYLVVFSDEENNKYVLGDSNTHPIAFKLLTVSQMQKSAANGNKSEHNWDGSDRRGQAATLADASLYTLVSMPSKTDVKQIGGQYYSPDWNAALHYVNASIAKRWLNIPQRIPEGASVTLTLTGKTERSVEVVNRTFTMTQGSGVTTVTLSPAQGDTETFTVTTENQDNSLLSYVWTLANVALQAEGSGGKITYTVKETFEADNHSMVNNGTAVFDADTNTWSAENQRDWAELEIMKAVTNDADDTHDFTFTLTVDEMKNRTTKVTVTKGNTTVSEGTKDFTAAGTLTLTLKSGEKATISLPVGAAFSVTETSGVAYTTTYSDSLGNKTQGTVGELPKKGASATFVNTYTTINIEGKKTWNDSDNADSLRPASITVRLWADGEEIDSATATERNRWAWKWEDLREYRWDETQKDWVKIVYTVTEDPVDYYSAFIDGYNITNTQIVAVELEAVKTINGQTPKTSTYQSDIFTFTLAPVNNAPARKMDFTAYKTPELRVQNDGSRIDLPTLYFSVDDAGQTYSYTVRETVTVTRTGYTHDETLYTVNIALSLDADNKLIVTKTINKTVNGTDSQVDAMTFENPYEAKGTAKVQVAKHLTGRELKDTDEFTFTLSAINGAPLVGENGNDIAQSSLTIRNGQDEALVDFPILHYDITDEGQTYLYKIVENDFSDKVPGVKRDTVNGPAEIYARVAVPADQRTGSLGEATVSYFSDEECKKPLKKSQFVNQYVTDGKLQLGGRKFIDGRNFTQGDTATISITAKTPNAPLPENTTVTVDPTARESIEYFFDTIRYTLEHAGGAWSNRDYVYEIIESAYTMAGVKEKDTTVYTVTVNVKDDGSGALKVTASATSKKPTDTVSTDVKLEPDYNDAQKLHIVTGINFTNKYEATGTATVQVAKHLTGRELKDTDEFKFTLSAIDGAPMLDENKNAITTGLTIKHGKNGVLVNFPTLNYFHTLGHSGQTYKYKIVEEAFDVPGVTRDITTGPVEIYVMVAVPADTGSGSLGTATVTYYSDAECKNALTKSEFVNAYEATGTATVQVAKHLTGRELKDTDEFKFTLSAIDGAPLLDAEKNAIATESLTILHGGEGKLVEFPMLNYFHTLGHSDQTYKYKIVEENFDIPGVTRDTTTGPAEIYVKVVVPKDSGTSKLEPITVAYYSDAECKNALTKSEFVNAYEATGTATVQVAKHLTGRELKDTDEFKFTLSAIDGAPLLDAEKNAIATESLTILHGGEGKLVEFPMLNYFHTLGHSGKSYVYKIVEEDFTMPGVTRDTTTGPAEIYAKVVVPKDNGTSKLEPITVTYYSDEACTKKLTKSEFVNQYEATGTAMVQVAKHLTGRTLLETDEFKFTLSAINGAPLLDENKNAIEATSLTIMHGADGVLVNFPTLNYFHTLGHSGQTYVYKIVEEDFNIPGVSRDTTNGPVEIYAKVVVPADNATSKLEPITVTYYSDAACETELEKSQFVNEYDAKGSIKLGGDKIVQYRDFMEGDTIKFTIERVTDGAPLPTIIEADGTVRPAPTTFELDAYAVKTSATVAPYMFEAINYWLVDAGGENGSREYTYKITETYCKMNVNAAGEVIEGTEGAIGKVMPDESVYEVTVKVSDSTTDHPGNLKVEVTKVTKDGAEVYPTSSIPDISITVTGDGTDGQTVTAKGFNFKNPYQTDAKVNVEAQKILTGRDMAKDEFTFKLYLQEIKDAEDKVIFAVDETKRNEAAPNGQPGAVTFSDIQFVLNPDSTFTMNPTADGANSGYWDVSKLINIDKPQPVTWTLTLTEEITTQMPIGVKPVVNTFDVNLTLNYDRATGKLTAEIDKDKAALTFRNDFTPTEKGVAKFWDDENDQDGLRPDHLNVHLKWYYVDEGQNNTRDILELKNAWEAQFAAIGVTDIKSVLGYDLSEMKDPYVLNKGNHWSYMVTGLPTTRDGLDIDYIWTEDLETNDYGVIDPAVAEHLTIFKNKHETEKISVSAEKVWEDSNNEKKMRESIEVQLYANGKAYGPSVVLSESYGWKHTWPDLPKNTNPTGEHSSEIRYTVEELNIPEGYIATITGDATTGFVLTNTLPDEDLVIRKTFLSDPEEPIFDKGLVNIPVTKIWVDNDNEAGMRPNAITAHLFAGGTEIDTATLTAANGWTHLFRDLPIYNDDEQEITYSVTEDAVPNYISEVDGYNITNTYQSELISVAVQKVWDDDNNAAGKRPRSIVMTLSNGMRVVLNDANGWTAAITGLPAYINGQPAVYTWTEQTVAGYTQSSSVTTGSVTVVTNKLYNRRPPSYYLIEYDTPLGIEIDVNHVGDCFD